MGPRLQVAKAENYARSESAEANRIEFGRDIADDLAAAETREWLATNGIGGFASGTIAGLPTRRYHGLLVASLKPPLGRTLLVSHFEESVEYDGRRFELSTCRWKGGSVSPEGYRNIETFFLDGTIPVWTFACADALIEKRIWMGQGENTTYVSYKLVRGSGPIQIEIKAMVNYRDYHASTHAGDWQMRIERAEHGARIVAFDGAVPFYLLSSTADAELAHEWYRDFDHAAERCRGLDDHEDHLHAVTFRATLEARKTVAIAASTDAEAELDGTEAHRVHMEHEESLIERFEGRNQLGGEGAPAWIRQLVLAADQFVAQRPLSDEPDGKTILAGYHWFGDWGRDTMISFPGITLTTCRHEIGERILRTFARFVDGGMLPNVFPDAGQAPEYNTVDAALWYFEAVRQYVAATHDLELLRELYPVLVDVVDAHLRGTRYQIHADPEDGLLYAGEAGVQLTWMDAKVGDWVVTPRIGKPVEINALWLNAVSTMTEFARLLGRPTAGHACLVKRARKGFSRFWNEATQCCFDVLDGPNGNDAAIRPNQIFAVSLPESALTTEQQKAVVDTCGRHLLTSHGLRSLSPVDAQYHGHYGGGPSERDGAYHQGTVWAWLLGPFALAHLRVYNNPAQAAGFLEPIGNHLKVHGVGSISEIFDGDAPFTPRGCIAQAWSVGEVLRAWTTIARARKPTPSFAKGCNA
jgi:predicted glycogen debranching enzyme